MSLRFRQLQALHAVMESGTVTAAAQALGISQPAISSLLAQLEAQTRLSLFKRERGRLTPTPEAEVLFREIDTVVRGIDHVGQAVTDLQNRQTGQLQVASTHALSFGFMPREIARFAADRPGMSVFYQSQYTPRIQEWVMAGLFEIGVCEEPIRHDGLNATRMRFELQCALPAGHPVANYDTLTPELLDNTPFIVMGPDHMTNRRTREAFAAAGARLNARCHTHLFRNMLSFVQEGMGVCLIDAFSLDFDRHGGHIVRPFSPAIHIDMAIVTSRNRPLSVIGRAFVDQLTEALSSYATTRIPRHPD